MPVDQKPFSLLSEGELGISEAEQSHLPVGERLQFCGAAANVIVFAEHDPAVLACKRQPGRVISLLSCLLALDVGQRLDY